MEEKETTYVPVPDEEFTKYFVGPRPRARRPGRWQDLEDALVEHKHLIVSNVGPTLYATLTNHFPGRVHRRKLVDGRFLVWLEDQQATENQPTG